MIHVSTVLFRLVAVMFHVVLYLIMSTYKGLTPARAKANEKYLSEKVDTIVVRLPKGEKDKARAAADRAGVSLNRYCADAILRRVQCDTDNNT